MQSVIFHLDMDAFFASVEERDHPEFKGMPIVVGADPKEGRGRGVVSTANYEARKYGIGSAMPITKAWHLCQAGEGRGGNKCFFFGGSMRKYAEESKRIMGIISKLVHKIEQAGLDEAYFEIKEFKEIKSPKSKDKMKSKIQRLKMDKWKQSEKVARKIKKEIKRETGLTCSIGIGPNKLVAKVASDFNKPDGLTVVRPNMVEGFLAPLPIRRIPGIGPKAASVLYRRRIRTIGDAQRVSEREFIKWFGKSGSGTYERVHGMDSRVLEVAHEKKSIGHEMTFMKDTSDPVRLIDALNGLSDKVASEVSASGLLAKRITLRIRFDDFTTLTRQMTLGKPTYDSTVFRREALKLFMPFLDSRENPKGKAFRLLGVRAGSMTVEQSLGI